MQTTSGYDGDGHPLKMSEETTNSPDWQIVLTEAKYQIWSSGLGGFLSEAKETGAKEKTKVYAGGAVVAEQTAVGVLWTHADPLTGSSIKVRRSGVEYERKEYEPLGQEVAAVEPEEENPSPGGSSSELERADDPQWQCQVSGAIGADFFAIPAHCQWAAIDNVWLADIYATRSENKPQRINEATDSPLPDYDYSASGETLAYALSSSGKPDKKAGRSDGLTKNSITQKI